MAETTALAEWKRHGGLVLAAFAGLSLYSVTGHSIGVFVDPLQAELAGAEPRS